jgi:hypothetical protein
MGSGAIGANDIVGQVIAHHPELLPIFQAFGFRLLANPVLRRTMAARVTIGQACRLVGVDPSKLLEALNSARLGGDRAGKDLEECECGNRCVTAGME